MLYTQQEILELLQKDNSNILQYHPWPVFAYFFRKKAGQKILTRLKELQVFDSNTRFNQSSCNFTDTEDCWSIDDDNTTYILAIKWDAAHVVNELFDPDNLIALKILQKFCTIARLELNVPELNKYELSNGDTQKKLILRFHKINLAHDKASKNLMISKILYNVLLCLCVTVGILAYFIAHFNPVVVVMLTLVALIVFVSARQSTLKNKNSAIDTTSQDISQQILLLKNHKSASDTPSQDALCRIVPGPSTDNQDHQGLWWWQCYGGLCSQHVSSSSDNSQHHDFWR